MKDYYNNRRRLELRDDNLWPENQELAISLWTPEMDARFILPDVSMVGSDRMSLRMLMAYCEDARRDWFQKGELACLIFPDFVCPDCHQDYCETLADGSLRDEGITPPLKSEQFFEIARRSAEELGATRHATLFLPDTERDFPAMVLHYESALVRPIDAFWREVDGKLRFEGIMDD